MTDRQRWKHRTKKPPAAGGLAPEPRLQMRDKLCRCCRPNPTDGAALPRRSLKTIENENGNLAAGNYVRQIARSYSRVEKVGRKSLSIDNIHLRKLIKLFFCRESLRVSEIRALIRTEIARSQGESAAGGDFHVPFWSDAKAHVIGRIDLVSAVQARINSNPRRERLYTMLRDGFLEWWDRRRRWTNEPFELLDGPRGTYVFPALAATVKVDNIVAVRDAAGTDRFVYPYFSEEPALTPESSRLALWLLSAALPHMDINQIRILDVIRGRTFSIDRVPFNGDEEEEFRRRYARLIEDWQVLRSEYDL